MMYAYTRPRTVDLVLYELCRHPIGTLIVTSVRDLATKVGRSEGQMSKHLDRLAADGWIRRLADHAGTVVEVLRTVVGPQTIDHPHDRSFSASESDHDSDRPLNSDHPTETPSPIDARVKTEQMSDHADDPPLHPPIRYKHESHEQQQHDARALSIRSHPTWSALREAGAAESVADRILVTNPHLTIVEFETMRSAAKRRSGGRTNDSIGLVFWCLQRGEKLSSSKEPSHERSERRTQSSRTGHRRHAADRRATNIGGAEAAPVDYAALLAEIAADNPGMLLRG